MVFKRILQMLTMAVLSPLFTTSASPEFYPLPFTHKPRPPTNIPQRPASNSAPFWHKSHQQNFSQAGPSYLDPLTSHAAEEVLKNDIPRQAYGGYLPPPVATTYPQIYKLDNLIIIANPPQVQAQPCPPQRPPPDLPPIGGGDDVLNRLGGDSEGPSKCTWAIVACCSPGNNNVRYNCFELLGCPGLFFDNSPCQPNIVMAAANAALQFYRNANNGNRTDTTNNNQL